MKSTTKVIPGEKSGRQSYSRDKINARRDARRADADARQAAYNKLTVQQRIDRATARRGESYREITRLTQPLISATRKP